MTDAMAAVTADVIADVTAVIMSETKAALMADGNSIGARQSPDFRP